MSAKAIAEKRKIVEDLKEKINRAKIMVVADYLGYSVKQLTELRKKLRPANAEFSVFKNTLIEQAAEESGLAALNEHLKGATALLLGYGEPVGSLKVLVKYIKEADKGTIRVGVLDKNIFGQSDLNAIAKLPSREVLLARVVGGLQAPIAGLVNVMQGPIRKLVYALNAVKEKKGGE